MGNTGSNANSHRIIDRIDSPSPSPGNPHPSLRTKRKSLELPDLASLSSANSRGRQISTPPKSASIPIPAGPPPPSIIPGEAGRQRPPPSFASTTDVLIQEPSTHIPFPPPSNNRFRNRQRSAQQQQRIQELYNQSHVLPPPPPSPTSSIPKFIPETVLSSLPVGLTKAVALSDIAGIAAIDEIPQPELVPGRITWRGGGKTVFLSRAGDDDWKGRQTMERESPTSTIYHATVALPPGTHHIRFLVDDQWRVADDLPTAVDDQGTLANYVDVPISYSPPNPSAAVPSPSPPKTQPPKQTKKLQPGQSFWSAASSTDDESQDHPADHHYHSHHHHHQHQHTHQGPSSPQQRHHHHGHSHSHHGGIWTSVLPPELIEAAREEEAYLNASSAETSTHTRGGTTYVNGFVPAPNIPPAPGLPRHLDKLILNSRVIPPTPAGSTSGRGSGSTSGGGGKKHSGGGGGGGGGTSTGASVGRKQGRERERKERERERDKQERRREKRSGGNSGGVPPAPPPSEAGDPPAVETPETPTPTPSGESSIPTSPVISTPPTSPPLSATHTPPPTTTPVPFPAPSAGGSGSPTHGHGQVPSLNLSLAASPWISSSPVPPHASSTPTPSTFTSTPTPPNAFPSHTPTPAPTPAPPTTPSTRPLTHPLGLGLEVNEPALADDASMLPVPSHVVLHHLSTSAIRNGVLAVGNTTRYKKKYLTTVYYKPT